MAEIDIKESIFNNRPALRMQKIILVAIMEIALSILAFLRILAGSFLRSFGSRGSNFPAIVAMPRQI